MPRLLDLLSCPHTLCVSGWRQGEWESASVTQKARECSLKSCKIEPLSHIVKCDKLFYFWLSYVELNTFHKSSQIHRAKYNRPKP